MTAAVKSTMLDMRGFDLQEKEDIPADLPTVIGENNAKSVRFYISESGLQLH